MLTSTYQATIGGADEDDLARRCRIALSETAVNRNSAKVPNAAKLLSLEAIDRLKGEAEAAAAASLVGMDVEIARLGDDAVSAAAYLDARQKREDAKVAVKAANAAQIERARAEHAQLVAPVERSILRHAVVKDFFTGGSIEGPFPGSRSAQGEFLAETFWSQTAEVSGGPGQFATARRTEKYAASGYRLTNHARL